jgi:UPF0176 protein
LNAEQIAVAASQEEPAYVVAAFYKFIAIDDPSALQRSLRIFCAKHAIKGTILLAHEGINATISGEGAAVSSFLDVLRADPRFADIAIKRSAAREHPFRRLKVKIKREIVTLGIEEALLPLQTAEAVEPEDWNRLILDPKVLVIDTRNDYEVEVGTFEGARNPKTHAFRDFPDYVARELAHAPERKIAMFCTGGIRCEKASAYLLSKGFTNVYQLNGGILRYLERIAPEKSLWRGECFVFDERVALEHGVQTGHHALCERCGRPVRISDTQSQSNFCASCRANDATSSPL